LEYLGSHNKPKAEVHPGHKLTGPKEEEKEEEEDHHLYDTEVRQKPRFSKVRMKCL